MTTQNKQALIWLAAGFCLLLAPQISTGILMGIALRFTDDTQWVQGVGIGIMILCQYTLFVGLDYALTVIGGSGAPEDGERMRRSFWTTANLNPVRWYWIAGAAVLTVPFLIQLGIVGELWAQLLKAFNITPGPVPNEELAQDNFTLLAVSALLAAPFLEEIIFRGWIFNAVKSWIPPVPAALVVSFFFAALHGTLAQFPMLLILGLMFSVLYLCSGSLWPGITMHFCNNLISLALLWLKINGFYLEE